MRYRLRFLTKPSWANYPFKKIDTLICIYSQLISQLVLRSKTTIACTVYNNNATFRSPASLDFLRQDVKASVDRHELFRLESQESRRLRPLFGKTMFQRGQL